MRLQPHTAGPSRVVDNLEAIPFFERQVVGRPRLVVVQRHKERDATCGRPESAFETFFWIKCLLIQDCVMPPGLVWLMMPSHVQQGEATELWRVGLERELQQGGLDLAKHLRRDYPPEEGETRAAGACAWPEGQTPSFRGRCATIPMWHNETCFNGRTKQNSETKHCFDMENTHLHESTASDWETCFFS